MDTAKSLLVTLPELTLSLSSLVLLLVAAWGGAKSARIVSILAVAALVAATAFALTTRGDAFGGLYVADAFSGFAKLLIYAAAAVALMMAPRFFARQGLMRAEYPVLVLLAAIGMGMMVSAQDLLTLYIGLELNSLAGYVLASFLRTDERSAEAGLKYFVLGALASGILLFGMSFVYGFTGSTGYDVIGRAMTGELATGALFGIVFMLAGLAFKIAAVPFHMWTPDVYEGAPTPVTAFFATANKVAAVALLIRVVIEGFGAQLGAWQQIVIFIALASILLGAAGAIGQSNIKRLLAYSSINNVGFILVGLAAATPTGVEAMLIYLAIYIAMTLGSFLCVQMLVGPDGAPREDIADLAGLSRTRPGLALMLAMFMFSLAGIPPLFGFFPKLAVFIAAVDAGLFWLAVAAAVASVVGAYYYLKIVKILYFDEPADRIARSDSPTFAVLAMICALLVSPLGYLAIPALRLATGEAAAALF